MADFYIKDTVFFVEIYIYIYNYVFCFLKMKAVLPHAMFHVFVNACLIIKGNILGILFALY